MAITEGVNLGKERAGSFHRDLHFDLKADDAWETAQ
jgi:hypothetical protein